MHGINELELEQVSGGANSVYDEGAGAAGFWTGTYAGAAGGALIGFAFGGPVGAAVGAIAGGFGSSTILTWGAGR